MYRYLENLCWKWIDPEGRRNWIRDFLLFLAITILIMAAVLWLGPYPITKFPLDTAYMLIQGDYLLNEYRPYVDYYSMHGPLPFLFSAVGMRLHGVSLQSIVLAQILGATVFGLLMYKVASSRLHTFWAILLAISIELILIACTPIGSKAWREFACAMWYNAIGFSIQAIIFLYLLVPSRSKLSVSRWTDCGIVTLCLAGCFLTKMSFFAPTALLFFVGTILIPRDKEMFVHGLVAILVGGLAAYGTMELFDGSLRSYFAFLESLTFRANPLFLSFRFLQYTRTLGVFILGVGLIGWLAKDAGLNKRVWREWILVLLMLGTLLLSASTAAQDQEILPMLGVVPLGMTVYVCGLAIRERRPVNIQLVASALFVSLLLLLHAPKNGALSWVFSHIKVPIFSESIARYSDADIEAMNLDLPAKVDPQLFSLMPKGWADKQFAAIRLLDQYAPDGDTIFVATTNNSIAMLTDLKYAAGQAAWWPYMFTSKPEDLPLFDDHLLEDARWLLRDMHDSRCWTYLRHHRGDYIDENFELVAENNAWQLLRKKDVDLPDEQLSPTSGGNARNESASDTL